jgi:AcrR family transcriptional regulator
MGALSPLAMEKDRKETLLEIGERLFAERGYRDVGVKDVTDAAGLGTASFYTYFSSKEAFYAQIIDRLEQREIRELERHVGSFKSPLNKLKALFRHAMFRLRDNPILQGVHAGERRYLYPGAQARALGNDGMLSRVEKIMDGILAEGTRKGIFRVNVFRDPKRMLMTVFGSMLSDLGRAHSEDLIADIALLAERGIKRWLHFMRDERLDRRASRIP